MQRMGPAIQRVMDNVPTLPCVHDETAFPTMITTTVRGAGPNLIGYCSPLSNEPFVLAHHLHRLLIQIGHALPKLYETNGARACFARSALARVAAFGDCGAFSCACAIFAAPTSGTSASDSSFSNKVHWPASGFNRHFETAVTP
jgi:hypothetical protein